MVKGYYYPGRGDRAVCRMLNRRVRTHVEFAKVGAVAAGAGRPGSESALYRCRYHIMQTVRKIVLHPIGRTRYGVSCTASLARKSLRASLMGDLAGVFARLPAHLTIDIEFPMRDLDDEGVPPTDQARRLVTATNELLARARVHRSV